jgi:peptidoglycan/LPS O-acetylase OafA/YrhL
MQIYRRDIDGLRAIAVVSVVLFHAGTPGFGGGFLGVDVFFVISGYLITQMLTGAQPAGIAAFYERRVRRIAPALIAVLLACSAAALVLLSPYELKAFCKSLITVTAFVANFHFMISTGYFQLLAETNPLLHLWSLSVEEQFYVAYPLFLWAMRRFPKALLPALLAGLGVSFAISVWLAATNPTVAFYFTPSRAWELLLGAGVALRPWSSPLPRAAGEALALAGLALVLAPVFLFASHATWPGLNAAIPCGGAAVLLWLGGGTPTWTARLLGAKPLAGIGLISYSLYLWHWPIFVFFGRAVLRPIQPEEYAALIALAVAAAWLSWRFVEQPFRKPDGVSRAVVFSLTAAGAAALMVLGAAGFAAGGLPGRFPPAVQRIDAYLDYSATPLFRSGFRVGTCFALQNSDVYTYDRCFTPAPDRPNIVLWGDSHALNYLVGLHSEAERAGIHLIQATYHSCRPILHNPGATAACARFNREIFARLDRRISAVILSARLFGEDDALIPLRDTARLIAAKGVRVIVLGPSLAYRQRVPLYVAQFAATGDPAMLDSRGRLRPDLDPLDEKMHALFAQEAGISFISVRDTVCRGDLCPMAANGLPLLFDDTHLTLDGSMRFGQALWPQIRAALQAGHAGSSLNSPPRGR